MLAGCTGDPGDASRSPAPDDSPTAVAQVRVPEQDVTVLPGTDPADLAAATSRALFAGSRQVVLAAVEDPDAQRRAAATARENGVPLLLAGDAAAQELERLGTEEVLTAGPAASAWFRQRYPADGPRLQELPATAPPAPAAEPTDTAAPTTMVLTGGDPQLEAVAATAAAAGAEVRVVAGGDPRSDAGLVADLASGPPARVVAVGDVFGPAELLTSRLETARTGLQVPGGGQLPLADRRMIALYGHPQTPSLGALGEQDMAATLARAHEVAADYDGLGGLPAVPALEIIATVASGSPGRDGNYSNEVDVEKLRPWVDAAGAAGVYVILDLQCGRQDCAEQAPIYAELLQRPHVGLALDPEWRLHGDQLPLRQIGSMHAEEINRVAAWLAELTDTHDLPRKVFLLHQFRLSMIKDRDALDTGHDELTVVLHADGNGTPGQKLDTYAALTASSPDGVRWAWKNFYRVDDPTFTPEQTVAVDPSPVFVSYQ